MRAYSSGQMRWAFIAVTFLDQVNLSVTINPYHRHQVGLYQIDTLKVGEYAYLAMSDGVNPIRIGRIEAAEIDGSILQTKNNSSSDNLNSASSVNHSSFLDGMKKVSLAGGLLRDPGRP